ncbi:hypothetical protein [Arthrobacter sp. NPDC089319]|uniref:hypothetical protein n=1 Tax=Arthrobacter sp. NPDC089319 TaxID=3155915 RepID=UPI003448F8F2
MGNALRFGRSAVVAAAVLCLAAAAHTAAGGTLPPPAVVLALGALTWLPVMMLAGRRLEPGTILAVLAGGQLALHQAFELFGTVQCAPSGVAEHAGHAGHAGHAAVALDCVAASHAGNSPGMLAAHLLATALTALMLAGGEAALWALAAWLRPLVQLPAVPAAPVRASLPLSEQGPVPLHTAYRVTVVPLRGPPVPVSVPFPG